MFFNSIKLNISNTNSLKFHFLLFELFSDTQQTPSKKQKLQEILPKQTSNMSYLFI